jgi:hypothetical protein
MTSSGSTKALIGGLADGPARIGRRTPDRRIVSGAFLRDAVIIGRSPVADTTPAIFVLLARPPRPARPHHATVGPAAQYILEGTVALT